MEKKHFTSCDLMKEVQEKSEEQLSCLADFIGEMLREEMKNFYLESAPHDVEKHILKVGDKENREEENVLRGVEDKQNIIEENVSQEDKQNSLESFVNVWCTFFEYFRDAVLLESARSDFLFAHIILFLKKTAISLGKIHIFLFLLLQTQYIQQSSLNLWKFFVTYKFYFDKDSLFDKVYVKPLENFLLFCMLGNYKKEDDKTHLLREETATFYAEVIKKYYSVNLEEKISYLKKLLMQPGRSFYFCYSILIIIKALGLFAVSQVIPDAFSILAFKVNNLLGSPGKLFHVHEKEEFDELSEWETDSEDFENDSKRQKIIDEDTGSPNSSSSEEDSSFNKNRSPVKSDFKENSESEEEVDDPAEMNMSDTNSEGFEDIEVSEEVENKILSEKKYASLLQKELLCVCTQLSQYFIEYVLDVAEAEIDVSNPQTPVPIDSKTVKKFRNHFGYKFYYQLHLPSFKYIFKKYKRKDYEPFTYMFLTELQCIAKKSFC